MENHVEGCSFDTCLIAAERLDGVRRRMPMLAGRGPIEVEPQPWRGDDCLRLILRFDMQKKIKYFQKLIACCDGREDRHNVTRNSFMFWCLSVFRYPPHTHTHTHLKI